MSWIQISVFVALALVALFVWIAITPNLSLIDDRIKNFIGDHSAFKAQSHRFPLYRFVDLYRAIEAFAEDKTCEVIHSHHEVYLHDILHNPGSLSMYGSNMRNINDAAKDMMKTGPDTEELFPIDSFFLISLSGAQKKESIILRLKQKKVADYHELHNPTLLELAGASAPKLAEVKDWIQTWSIDNSIYKGKMLEAIFGTEIKGEYGHINTPQGVEIEFRSLPRVSQDDIIIDDTTADILENNVFDFHEHSMLLHELGLPLQRGLLFYGPPGTGKTYTCRYIASRLEGMTTFLVSGNSLPHMESISNLARLYQPSLLILEDVDLMFSNREINLYSSALGDFMDQLDGLHKDDAIMFLLTTNAIERLEEAIKDRPGRISQCIFMGPPNDKLRLRYLAFHAREYNCKQTDFDQVVKMTTDCTQAFIKELVLRAVQFAAKAKGYQSKDIQLSTTHFQEAFQEITMNSEKQVQSIVGFRIN